MSASPNTSGRTLAVITDELRRVLQSGTADSIEIGRLLSEAKDQLDHGQWLPWLQQEFGYSARTAQNYMRAHKFAGKYENVSDLKLTSTALYRLVDTSRRRRARTSIYTAEAIAAIIAEAKEKRVGTARAYEIAMSLRRQAEAQPTGEGAPAPKPDSEPDPTPTLQPAPPPRQPAPRERFVAAMRSWRHSPPSRAEILLASYRPIAWNWLSTF
jgi:hypothetical protein